MARIGPTDRRFELHYAANVVSNLWGFFFSLFFCFLFLATCCADIQTVLSIN